MDCGTNCVKYLIFVFNFLFWLSGIAIIVVASLALVELKKYGDIMESPFTAGAVVLIVVGCIVTVVAFFGCCGAIKENHCMVMTFAILLGIIFVLELAAGITCYVYRNEIEKMSKDVVMKSWSEYDPATKKDLSNMIDAAQHDMKCCGVNNYTDWRNFNWTKTAIPPNSVPDSCCKDDTKACGSGALVNPTNINQKGCYETLKATLESQVLIVAGLGVGIAFIQIIGIVFACCLAKSIKQYEVV